MAEKRVPKWLPWVGYPAFFLIATVVFIHLTLPYGALESRLVEEARKQGLALSMVSFGPSLMFGATAKGVMLTALPEQGSATAKAPPKAAALLDSVRVRPTLFPPGLSFSISAFGGTVHAALANVKAGVHVQVHGKDLDLARAGLKGLVGLDLAGHAAIDADLIMPPSALEKTTGTVELTGKALVVNGGTVNFIDLPKAELGNADIKIAAKGGKAQIETVKLDGGDVDAKVEPGAVISLGQRIQTSTVRAKIQFKPREAWLKKYSFIQTGLHMAGRPNASGYYTLSLNGLLLNPRPNLRGN